MNHSRPAHAATTPIRAITHTPRAGVVWALALVLLASACATPVGVKRTNPRAVHQALTESVISSNQPSEATQNVLFRLGLATLYHDQPLAALTALHARAVAEDSTPGEIFAMAELSFQYAERSHDRAFYLVSALYAWAYLFPEAPADRPSSYDPRLRLACNLYNRGLTEGLASADGKEVELKGGVTKLPFSDLTVEFAPDELRWADRRLGHFSPVAEFKIHGLNNRYRRSGIGAPLAAEALPPGPDQPVDPFVAQDVKVPVTALLRFDQPRTQLRTGHVRARLELYTEDETEAITIAQRTVPLETEPTASLAFTLADKEIWTREIKGFLRGDFSIGDPTRLLALKPYRPGRIPVVLVHGTASTYGRWANMVNELENDPQIRSHFQFWFFSYDTANPITYSALLLRDELERAAATLDPDGRDPALRHMVLIGHSQGGLLTKLMAVDTGDQLWRGISQRPLADLNLSRGTLDLIQRSMFLKPLPNLRRVVFIATPHRGSFLASRRLVQWLTTKLIKLPAELIETSTEIVKASSQLLVGNVDDPLYHSLDLLPTSVNNMNPSSRLIKALAAIPVAPDVTAHSIIAVKGDGPAEEGNDGVVTYKSAHLEHVASEKVVRCGHSCQSHVEVIAEVRRILLEELTQYESEGGAQAAGRSPAAVPSAH